MAQCIAKDSLTQHHLGTYSHDLHKMIYLQNRRYLPLNSKLRQQKGLPSKKAELEPPPKKRKFDEVKEQHDFI